MTGPTPPRSALAKSRLSASGAWPPTASAPGNVVERVLHPRVVVRAQRDGVDELLRAGAADRAGERGAIDVDHAGERGHGRADVLDLVALEADAVDVAVAHQRAAVAVEDLAAGGGLARRAQAPVRPEAGMDHLRGPQICHASSVLRSRIAES